MRINKFVASATGLSRRSADIAIAKDKVKVNGQIAQLGVIVNAQDTVTFDGHIITLPEQMTTIIFNKPTGYVCSRLEQGSKTIYALLPKEFHSLKSVGRLDKDSSGLLILTNDGDSAEQLAHPRNQKEKIYDVRLNKPLSRQHQQTISVKGVNLNDGNSKLLLGHLDEKGQFWQVKISEGRNRQIRRTFAALGYKVIKLHRISFGPYVLGNIPPGKYVVLNG